MYSYYHKEKDIVEDFRKPMKQISIKELRDFLLKYLKEERKLSTKSINYYNNVYKRD